MKKFGIALSGGGYRAATYHIGTLRALHHLKVLDQVKVIATNSGGSITGAYYALNCNKLKYPKLEANLLKALKKNTLRASILHAKVFPGLVLLLSLLLLTLYFLFFNSVWLGIGIFILFLFVLLKYQFKVFPISRGIEGAYNKFFFKKAQLGDLPDNPILVMNATNVETGKMWSFSKNSMNDYEYFFKLTPSVEFKSKNFPIARAVNASSCVPFAFSPVTIKERFYLNANDIDRAKPLLVDGGVYDNQGIHKLVQDDSRYECHKILVSDAGARIKWQSSQSNVSTLLIRMMDIFMLRIKNLQMISGVYDNSSDKDKLREIGYFSLGWNIIETPKYFIDAFKDGKLIAEVIDTHELKGRENEDNATLIQFIKDRINWEELSNGFPDKAEIKTARSVSTNLTPLKPAQSEALIKHAYSMTIVFMKLYCPSVQSNQLAL